VVIVLLFILLNYGLIKIIYPDLKAFVSSSRWFFQNLIEMSNKAQVSLTVCLFGLFTLVNWVIAFFRFRESEII